MSDELFPADAVAMDSPRLAWLKKHQLETQQVGELAGLEDDFGNEIPKWVCRVSSKDHHLYRPSEIAGGDTEDEACAELARIRGLKLWFEETP